MGRRILSRLVSELLCYCVAVFGDGSSQLICSLDLTSPRVVTSVVSISAYAISTDTL